MPVLATGAWVTWEHVLRPARIQASLAEAIEHLSAGRFESACAAADVVLKNRPEESDAARAHLIAGQAAARLANVDAALGHFESLIENSPESVEQMDLSQRVLTFATRGDLRLKRGRITAAIEDFDTALELNPDLPIAHSRLALCYAAGGVPRFGHSHLLRLLATGTITVRELLILADPRRDVRLPENDAEGFQDVEDPYRLLAAVQDSRRESDFAAATETLERLREFGVLAAEVWVEEKRIVAERDGLSALAAEFVSPPEGVEQLIEYWILRGRVHRHAGDFEGAAHCFLRVLALRPDHLEAARDLPNLLITAGRPAWAAVVAERVAPLADLMNAVDTVHHEPNVGHVMRVCAESCEKLGRYPEAAAWSGHATKINPTLTWPAEVNARVLPRLRSANRFVWITPGVTTGERLDYGQLRLASIDSLAVPAISGGGHNSEPSGSPQSHPFAFVDEAEAVGLRFAAFRLPRHDDGYHIDEAFGTGVAAFDYDGDARPDLYLTQINGEAPRDPTRGGVAPEAAGADVALPEGTRPTDQLFRNRLGESYVDVTGQAGIDRPEYALGVAAGDCDGDGFPDLYLGCIGRNVLMLNNGDGTFRDASGTLPDLPGVFTSSVAVADLDADGVADFYDCNYVTGTYAEDICWTSDREHIFGCGPLNFPHEPDQLLLGGPRPRVAGPEAGLGDSTGNGLGVVVGQFDGADGLDVFVAADMTKNLLYLGRPPEDKDSPLLNEVAVLHGAAFNGAGGLEACMGVAAGDPDHDGQIEFFITNFYDQTNTYYDGEEGGFFSDGTSEAGLADDGLLRLGFGSQFFDADLDGWEDLFVLNGHVNSYPSDDAPFRMSPRFYQNLGRVGRPGYFVPFEPEDSQNPFLNRPAVGRALARLDWNEDGRPDLIATDREVPVALLTNRTPPAGRSLAVRLVATRSHRDAVGARVRLSTEGGEQTSWRLAGDGYLCTNEPLLRFAVTDDDAVTGLSVEWPGGDVESFPPPAAGKQYVLVEGTGRARPVP